MATEVQTTPRRRTRIFYGWWIVLVGAGVLFLAQFARSFLVTPPEFNDLTILGRSMLILTRILGSLSLLFINPIAGYLVDRFGPRVVVTTALAIGGLGFLALSPAESGVSTYAAALLIGGSLFATSYIAVAKAATNWFSRNVGKAFAILLMGPAIVSLWPSLWFELSLELGTFPSPSPTASSTGTVAGTPFSTLILLTGIALCAATIVVFTLFRHRPQEYVAQPEEETFAEGEADVGGGESTAYRASTEQAGQSVRSILLSRPYLLYIGVLSLQAPVIFSLRLSTSEAYLDFLFTFSFRWLGAFELLLGVLGIAVLFMAGTLSDRYSRQRVVAAIIGIQLASACVILLADGDMAALALIVASSTGVAGIAAASLALQAEYFGRRHFGLLLGIQISAAALVFHVWSRIQPFALPSSIEEMGSGSIWVQHPLLPLVGAVLPLAIALVLILLMKRPQSAVPNPPVAETEPQVASP